MLYDDDDEDEDDLTERDDEEHREDVRDDREDERVFIESLEDQHQLDVERSVPATSDKSDYLAVPLGTYLIAKALGIDERAKVKLSGPPFNWHSLGWSKETIAERDREYRDLVAYYRKAEKVVHLNDRIASAKGDALKLSLKTYVDYFELYGWKRFSDSMTPAELRQLMRDKADDRRFISAVYDQEGNRRESVFVEAEIRLWQKHGWPPEVRQFSIEQFRRAARRNGWYATSWKTLLDPATAPACRADVIEADKAQDAKPLNTNQRAQAALVKIKEFEKFGWPDQMQPITERDFRKWAYRRLIDLDDKRGSERSVAAPEKQAEKDQDIFALLSEWHASGGRHFSDFMADKTGQKRAFWGKDKPVRQARSAAFLKDRDQWAEMVQMYKEKRIHEGLDPLSPEYWQKLREKERADNPESEASEPDRDDQSDVIDDADNEAGEKIDDMEDEADELEHDEDDSDADQRPGWIQRFFGRK